MNDVARGALDIPGFPHGDGEMARRIRGHDWAATPLGPIGSWPQSLRTAVDIMLQSQGPLSVLWGPECIQLYNDAYIAIAAERHPASLGRPAVENWPDAYESILGPVFDRVFAGEAVTLENQVVTFRRPDGEGAAERYFTASFSPIRDEAGAVAGIFHPATETTDRILGEAALRRSEARHRFRVELSDALRGLTSPSQIRAVVAERLGAHLGVDQANYYTIEGDRFVVTEEWRTAASPGVLGSHSVSDFGEGMDARRQAGEILRLDDTQGAEGAEAFAAAGMAAVLSVPLSRNGRWAAGLHVHQARARIWTDAEEMLLRDTAERTWAEIERVRAEAELRGSEDRQAFLLRLSDELRPLEAPGDIQQAASRLLAEHLDVSRALCAEMHGEGDSAELLIRAQHVRGVGLFPDRIPYKTFIDGFTHEMIRNGDTVVVADTASDPRFREDVRQNWLAAGMDALVALSILREGRVAYIFGVHSTGPRDWSPDEVALIEEVAERTWAAAERARAEAELRASQKWQAFLLRLSDALRPLSDPAEVQAEAARHLGEHLGSDRAYYVEVSEARGEFVVARDWHRPGTSSHAGRYPLDAWSMPWLASGETWVVRDVATDPAMPDERRDAYRRQEIGALIVVPLLRGGRLLGTWLTNQRSPRNWTTTEIRLVEEVAARTWEALERARAEQALRESEARLAMVLDQVPMGVSLFDAQGRYTLKNQRSSEILKGGSLPSRNPAEGQSWQGFDMAGRPVSPEDYPGARALRGETVEPPVDFLHMADGSDHWLRVSAVPLRGDDGAVSGGIVVAQDVTEELKVQRALRESEERLRAILETARDYAILTIDPEGLITTWPAGAQAVYGWTADEAVGRSVDMTFTPEDRATGAPETERITARTAGQAPDVRWHLRKDGSRIFIDGITRPLRAADGTIKGYVKVGQDVTVRRATEEALRESEARFQQFGDASGDALWVRDAATLAFEYLSPAVEEIYGTRAENLLRGNHVRRWLETIVPEDREAVISNLRRLREGEHVLQGFRILRSDGVVRWIRDTSFPLLDKDGRVQRIGGIAHDATEEVELQDRLKVLVAELQHRSRNLVSVVQGVSERTLATSDTLEGFRSRFRARLAALGRVNSLLSRLEEGDRITFDQLLQTELQAHGIVAFDGNGEQVTLWGPKGIRLRSATVQTFALAIHELATNALKYGALSRPEGRLEVKWSLLPVEGLGRRAGEQRLRVDWRETGVPVAGPDSVPTGPDAPPRRLGYGRELIERALPYQLKAQTTYRLAPDGVRCTIVVPVSSTLDVAFSVPGHGEG